MNIFDTHAHYEDEAFDSDREQILEQIQKAGVGRVVNVGSSLNTTYKTIELTKKFDFIYGAAGVHPEHVMELEEEEQYLNLETCLMEDKIVALGEIGLDYHYEDNPERHIQRKHFERQLALAEKCKKPVIIHSRDAAAETLDIMKQCGAEKLGGIVHCFSYGKEIAREYLNMGFYIGIGGVLTFKNARKLKEVADYVPLDRIVIETDCPYMAPEPNRGKRNDSGNLVYVVRTLAERKNVSDEEILRQTWKNGTAVYRMDEERIN